MIDLIKKAANKKFISIGLTIILFINLIVFPLFSKFSHTGSLHNKILDLRFGFSYDDVLKLMSELEENGRRMYEISILFIDTPYALFYPWVYAAIFWMILQKKNLLQLKKYVFLPFFIGFFDILENMGILYFIHSYPKEFLEPVDLFSLFNRLKWIFALINFIFLIYLLIKPIRKV